jgi:hypothetical protein
MIGMEEQSSEKLSEFIEKESKDYFKDVKYVTIVRCDNYWLDTKTVSIMFRSAFTDRSKGHLSPTLRMD